MSAASSSNWADESPCQTPCQTPGRSPAVVRGIGLIGVVRGFARSVLGLGRAMSSAFDRLENEGVEPFSANAGYDFSRVMILLRRAIHMADALRERLRTPAVAATLALARFRARAGERNERPLPAQPAELDDIMFQITFTRSDPETRQHVRKMIADMPDREVLTYIHADLLEASSILGEPEMEAVVRALGGKAVALLGDEADAVAPGNAVPGGVAPDTMVTRPAVHGRADEGPDMDPTQGARPMVREVGRGPP
jgi:hypothetical protein